MPVLPPLDPPPSNPTSQRRYVDIRHPAYPQSEQPLLRFGAIDGDNRDGVDFDIALVASGIITGNTWPSGFLTQKDDRGDFVRVDRLQSGILQRREYYYFVDDHEPDCKPTGGELIPPSSYPSYTSSKSSQLVDTDRPAYLDKYPVIPSFDHWRFPHGNLPAIWEEIIIPPAPRLPSLERKTAALARDTTCRISRYGGAIEVAHFVPMADEKWFLSNTMDRYGSSGSDPQPIDDPSNLITLRRDLHHLFNTRRFTFVPKRDRPDKARCLALHAFSPDDNNEVAPLYHNRSPAPLSGIAIEHVFARFAWTIFSDQTARFFKGLAEYAVLLFDPETGEIKEVKLRALDVQTQVEIFDAFPKSRSASSRKRQRGPSAQDDKFSVVEEEKGNASILHELEALMELGYPPRSTDSVRSEGQGAAVRKVRIPTRLPDPSEGAQAYQLYVGSLLTRRAAHASASARSQPRDEHEL